MVDDPLEIARQALERGKYGLVGQLLEPLAEQHPASTAQGAGIRLLMATALLGLGDTERATACCRSLQRCVDPDLRAQARDLLMVLEAPALSRPRSWSITLPDLSSTAPLEGVGQGLSRRRPLPPPPPPPPVGRTRAPVGFALVVTTVLLLIALLLGGCVEVRTDLRFAGPGRLQVVHLLHNRSGSPLPWQRRWVQALEATAFEGMVVEGDQRLSTAVLPADRALAALARSLLLASDLAGSSLPPPRLELKERNWLVGVHQTLRFDLDLSDVTPLAGLDLSVRLVPLRQRAVEKALPQPVQQRGDAVVWPLRLGSPNGLELHCWRWSPLGLGGVAIGLGLLMVLALQAMRLRLGFGLPQLPA